MAQRKTVTIVGITVILLVVVGWIIYSQLNSSQQKAQNSTEDYTTKLQKNSIKQATTPEDKASAYNALGGVYESNGKYSLALEARLKAKQVNPASVANPEIANNYCKVKDQANCAKYFQFTIKQIQSDSKDANKAFLPYYQKRLKAVKAGNLKDDPSFSEGIEP